MANGEHNAHWALRDALMDNGVESLMTFEIGQCYYIETLTKYYVGRVVSFDGCELTLVEASWVASTGLMTDFVRTGKPQNLEVEVIGDISLPVGMITAKMPWKHNPWKEPVR